MIPILERLVIDSILDLPFRWLVVEDEPGPDSDRAYLERNLIALVSNVEKTLIDRSPY